jgi:hypothetical protein
MLFSHCFCFYCIPFTLSHCCHFSCVVVIIHVLCALLLVALLIRTLHFSRIALLVHCSKFRVNYFVKVKLNPSPRVAISL